MIDETDLWSPLLRANTALPALQSKMQRGRGAGRFLFLKKIQDQVRQVEEFILKNQGKREKRQIRAGGEREKTKKMREKKEKNK